MQSERREKKPVTKGDSLWVGDNEPKALEEQNQTDEDQHGLQTSDDREPMWDEVDRR